jgi:hypothetical protein
MDFCKLFCISFYSYNKKIMTNKIQGEYDKGEWEKNKIKIIERENNMLLKIKIILVTILGSIQRMFLIKFFHFFRKKFSGDFNISFGIVPNFRPNNILVEKDSKKGKRPSIC